MEADRDIDEVDTLKRVPERQFIEYADYGPERWPISVVGGAEVLSRAFVAVTNPLERRVTIELTIGCDLRQQISLERMRPKNDQLKGEVIAAAAKDGRPLRPEYVRCKVTWAPKETLRIPREWLPAIRKVHDGVIVAGYAPFLKVDGEDYQMHSVLNTEPEPPVAPARRRASGAT